MWNLYFINVEGKHWKRAMGIVGLQPTKLFEKNIIETSQCIPKTIFKHKASQSLNPTTKGQTVTIATSWPKEL